MLSICLKKKRYYEFSEICLQVLMLTVFLPGPAGIMPCGGGPIMGIIGGPPIGGAGNMPGLGGPPTIQTLSVS